MKAVTADMFILTNVTEFWKVTLLSVPEIIRIFELTIISLTLQKHN